jgi:hypothetical protein
MRCASPGMHSGATGGSLFVAMRVNHMQILVYRVAPLHVHILAWTVAPLVVHSLWQCG